MADKNGTPKVHNDDPEATVGTGSSTTIKNDGEDRPETEGTVMYDEQGRAYLDY